MKASKKTVKGIVFFTVVLIIALVGIGFALDLDVFGNDDDSEESTGEVNTDQTIEVKRGNLTTNVSAFGNISMPHQADLSFGVGGKIEELNVKFGGIVKENDVLARLDTTSIQRSIANSEADLRVAQINLQRASTDVNIVQAEAAVESAQTALVSAEESLEQARNFSVSDAETNLENALRNLDTAQKNAEINTRDAQEAVDAASQTYNSFVNTNRENLSIGSIQAQKDDLWWVYEKALENQEIAEESAVTAIATAEANVTAAENALTNAPINIQQKESVVATAKAALIQAEKDLGYVQAGLDIELLQINVDKAQIVLDEMNDQLEKSIITAPFNGMVAEVNAVVGDEVNAGGAMASTVVIRLVDTTEVEIDAAVDEIDVAIVDVGQSAEIKVDALPKHKFSGEVTAVSPIGKNLSGLITYDLTVEISDPSDANLKDGMTASVDIEAVLADNVILVPNVAIEKDRASGDLTVKVVDQNDQEELRVVETGASNGKLMEITAGLQEGERIISSIDIEIAQNSQGGQSSGTSEEKSITECLSVVGEMQGCFKKLMELGEESGIDVSQYEGEIDWDEIEYWANDDSGLVADDMKECLDQLLENRGCLEQLMQMAEDMGIDTSTFNMDDLPM